MRAARDNVRRNRAGGLVAVIAADGVGTRAIRARAPFDLILANILLGPLARIAAPLRHLAARGCPRRAFRDIAVAGQCGDRGLSAAGARAAHRHRRLDHAGVHAARAAKAPSCPSPVGLLDCPACSKLTSNRSRIAPSPAPRAPRVAALRAELKVRGLDGFIVPRTDRFQNEYVPPSDERLAWLTGFTGSAGLAIVLAERAVLFVDGRYQVQVREEVGGEIFSIEHLVDNPPPAWIKANLPAGAQLGYSPWLHTVDGAERLAKACGEAGASLVAVEDNPIDAIWTDRPEPPLGAVVAHELRYAGEEAASKLARIRAEMAEPRRRYADGVRSARGVVAVQHPRQRRAAYAGGARFRHCAEGRPADAVRRLAQDRQ